MGKTRLLDKTHTVAFVVDVDGYFHDQLLRKWHTEKSGVKKKRD